MDEYLSFRKMITPLVITVVFWAGVALNVLIALGMMFRGGWGVLLGLVWLVLGPLMVRVYCEILILMFRIYEELVIVRGALAPNAAPTSFGFPVMPMGQAPVTSTPPTGIPPQF